MPVQLFNTFNHAVPALLCAVFVLTRSLPPSGYYLAGTLLLPSSPLGALLLLPYMAYETLFRRSSARKPLSRLRSLLGQPVFWLAALCTAVMAVFYSHLDGGGQFSACLTQNMRKSTITGSSGFCSIPVPPNTPASFWPWPWGSCCRGAPLPKMPEKPVVLHHAGHDGRQSLFPHGHHEQ